MIENRGVMMINQRYGPHLQDFAHWAFEFEHWHTSPPLHIHT